MDDKTKKLMKRFNAMSTEDIAQEIEVAELVLELRASQEGKKPAESPSAPKERACGKCGEIGHNARSCKKTPAAEVAAA